MPLAKLLFPGYRRARTAGQWARTYSGDGQSPRAAFAGLFDETPFLQPLDGAIYQMIVVTPTRVHDAQRVTDFSCLQSLGIGLPEDSENGFFQEPQALLSLSSGISHFALVVDSKYARLVEAAGGNTGMKGRNSDLPLAGRACDADRFCWRQGV